MRSFLSVRSGATLLAGLGLLAAALSAPAAGQTAQTADFIADYAKAHDFNGTVLIQEQGRIDYEHSFGLANRPFQVPNTPQTRYRIASITKAFTAVLLLQLYEAGKVDLRQTIGHYLPGYHGEAAHKVSLHQLLNHTSGIENFDQVKSLEEALNQGIPAYQAPATLDQLLQKYASGKLVHAPGEVFDYNNADYLILGRIIEQITGKPYPQVLQERILQPLGMTNSGMLRQRDIVPGLADSYFYREDLQAFSPDLPVYPENWYSAGAMYATARDLGKFSTALFGHQLLRPETLALMLQPGLDDYGYGVWSYERKIGDHRYRVIKRPGQIMGTQTQLYHFLDQNLTIILLSNAGRVDTDEFVAQIGKQLLLPAPAATPQPLK